MNRFIMMVLFVLGVVGAASAQSHHSQNWQGSATAKASATIIQPINIQKSADLQFGNIAVNNQAGTVIVATNGSRTSNGGITLPSEAGNVSAAGFSVTGEQNDTYVISLPGSATLTDNNKNSMVIDHFVSSLDNNTGKLSAQGSDDFNVGATLHVGASQPAGTYTGSFNVTVNYN